MKKISNEVSTNTKFGYRGSLSPTLFNMHSRRESLTFRKEREFIYLLRDYQIFKKYDLRN